MIKILVFSPIQRSGIPPNSMLFGGAVPPNSVLLGGTVPPNSVLFGGAVPPISCPLKRKQTLGCVTIICV